MSIVRTDAKDPFQRYVFPYMQSNMYVTLEEDEALIVDPHESSALMEIFQQVHIGRLLILLTHEHFDHTSGVNFYRRNIAETYVIAHAQCASYIAVPKNNRPLTLLTMLADADREALLSFYRSIAVEAISVDRCITEDTELCWRGHALRIVPCPGHSPGSAVVFFDGIYAFTGDYLIPDTPVILRFPGGSEDDYLKFTKLFLDKLPDGMKILPGHKAPYTFRKTFA